MRRKVAVVGSRDFKALDLVRVLIQGLAVGTTVVSGGAHGVDATAQITAERLGLPMVVVPAEWSKYGKKAGPMRNAEIVAQADEVFAFWDQRSKGTKNSIDLAIRCQKPLTIIFEDGKKEIFNPLIRSTPDFVGGV